MFCPMCGAPNEDDATYCGNCGAALTADAPPLEPALTEAGAAPPAEPVVGEEFDELPLDEEPMILPPPPPVAPAAPYVPVTPRLAAAAAAVPVNGMAVASLVLGIAGLTVLPLISSVFAVIFGYMARREIRQRPAHTSGDGVALAGIVLGWIGVGLLVVGALLGGGFLLCGICGAFGSGM